MAHGIVNCRQVFHIYVYYVDRRDKYLYEWDEPKRQETLLARGLDFADMAVFDWSNAITITDDRFEYGEVRFVSMGTIRGRLHVCAWCWRGDAVRIISLRKANENELRKYQAVHR